jgi:hypothetical protein
MEQYKNTVNTNTCITKTPTHYKTHTYRYTNPIFSAPVQTGPPNPLHNGYRVSLLGVKRPGRGVDHPPPSSAEVKERVELNLYSPSGSSWPVLGWILPLPLPLHLLRVFINLDGDIIRNYVCN